MRTVLADFKSSLNRIRAVTGRIVSETAAALASPQVRELHETQQCGAVVLTTGYLEAFLKDLVRRFIADLSQSGIDFQTLPGTIRDRHFEGGGDFVRKASIAGRSGHATPFGSVSREDVVARLHSVTSGATFDLVWEAFADTEANPGPAVVRKIGVALGLDRNHFWAEVSSRCGSPTWSATAMQASLRALIDKRNACAHTGMVSPVPAAAEIIEYVEMLAALGTGIVATLEDHLTTLAPHPPPAAAPPP